MKLAKNFLLGAGGLGVVVACGLLVAPQAAHALAAALVQVTNTAAVPAVTQDVSKLAGQSSQFWCPFSFVGCFSFPGVSTTYTVPSGQHLMITSVDFAYEGSGVPAANFYTLYCGPTNTLNSMIGEWRLAGGSAPTQFIYPSGFAVPAGCAVSVGAGGTNNYDVIVKGYLTAN
jgi:hypothetical protein